MKNFASACGLTMIFAAALLLTACMSTSASRALERAPYIPKNVYKTPLPAGKQLTRLALLPIVGSPQLGSAESLNGIRRAITEELGKTKKFELITISPDTLHEWAGVSELTSLDEWPQQLKETLTSRQIDGVVLIEITQLKGYHPIALGLKARLVGLPEGTTYWACDEVFDAAAPEVYSGAKAYEKAMLMITQSAKSQTTGTIELSPSKFAKYCAWTLFQTLP